MCSGHRADLKRFTGDRTIRSAFVVEIFDDRELADALPKSMVAIANATFVGPLELARHEIAVPLALEFSHFDSTIEMSRFATTSNLSLQGSTGGIVDLRFVHAGDVWLRGVSFSEVDLSNASIGGWVLADSAKIGVRFDLSGASIANSLVVDRSKIGDFLLPQAQIGSKLSVRSAVVDGRIEMSEATVGRQVEFDDSVVLKDSSLIDLAVEAHLRLPKNARNIDLSGSSINGDLLALGSRIDELQLSRAHVAGQASIAQASIENVQASGLTLAKDWNMVRSQIKARFLLQNAQIGGSVNFDHDTFPATGYVMSHVTMAGNFNLFNDDAPGPTLLSNVDVGGDLQLSGGHIGTIDATGSRVSGDLLLAQFAPIIWTPDALLGLHNVSVRAIEDRSPTCGSADTSSACDPWAPRLDLSGLTYEQLGSASASVLTTASKRQMVDDPVARPEAWWRQHWFAKQQPFSASPYDELSTVLRKFGNDEVADKVMYDRHDGEATMRNIFHNPSLLFQRLVIGYGYNVWLAFPWALGLVATGVLVLRCSGEGKRLGLPYGVTYSFDMLLPLVRLRESNYKLEPRGFVQYYFYVHKIAGFVLASFLVAALSGLTKQ